MAYQIQLRRDTANNWANINPILSQAEPGYEIDTGMMKYGDGVTAWKTLEYGITGDLQFQGTAIKSKQGVTLTSNAGLTNDWITSLPERVRR